MTHAWNRLARLIAVVGMLPASAIAAEIPYAIDPNVPIPGRIGIKMQSGFQLVPTLPTGISAIDNLNAQYGLTQILPMSVPNASTNQFYDQYHLGDYYEFYFAAGAPSPEELAAAYGALAEVELALPEYWVKCMQTVTPCDPLFPDQWSLSATATNNPLAPGMDVGAPAAWGQFTGAWNDVNNAIVAVIDDGAYRQHDELATTYGLGYWGPRDNFAWNTAEVEGSPTLDDDQNGFMNDVMGWDFNGFVDFTVGTIPADNDPSAIYGHGTAVSTIIAAEANIPPGHVGCSGLMAGVSWYSKVLPLKATPTWTVGSDTYYIPGYLDPVSIRRAVTYAVMNGAAIINCSFGYASLNPIPLDVPVYDFANANNVTLVASSGTFTFGPAPGQLPAWPAAFDYVFSVGGVDRSGFKKIVEFAGDWGSNYVNQYDSRQWLDAMGPAVDILAGWRSPNTYHSQEVTSFAGTSASAPMAAGTAALVRSRYPWLTSADVNHIMKYSARDQLGRPTEDTPGWDKHHGWGLVSAERAVKMIMPIVHESPAPGAWVQGFPTFAWRYVPVVNSYHLQVATNASFTPPLVIDNATIPGASYVPTAALPNGTLYWRVRYNVPTGWQPFTAATTIQVDNAAPATPTIQDPGSSCFYPDNTPSFHWSSDGGGGSPVQYTLQYTTDPAFVSNVTQVSGLTAPSYTVPDTNPFTGNSYYYWRVQATDAAGNSSAFQSPAPTPVIAADVGNVNASGYITSADVIYLVDYVFKGGPAPIPHSLVGNVNECSGGGGGPAFVVSSSDVQYLVNFVFHQPAPAPCGLSYPVGCGHD